MNASEVREVPIANVRRAAAVTSRYNVALEA
jgi:hypothetical protein